MSRSRKVACAVAVTVLLSTVVGAGLWWGGGVFTRQGWEVTSWVSAAGAFLLLCAPAWVWALRREEPAPVPVPPGARVDSSVAGDVPGVAVQGRDFLAPVTIHQGEREPASGVSAWSAPVAEVDFYQVGVHRSRSTNGPKGPDAVTAYVDRDVDADLRARVAASGREGGLVLVVGGSAAGKTRAAWQAVATQLPGHRLLVPAAGADLAHLPERARAEGTDGAGVVVWLDDMDRHLNTDRNLTAALVHTLTRERVVVVATLRQGPYDIYRDAVSRSGHSEDLVRIRAGQDIVRGVDPVRLERVWTLNELANGTRIAAQQHDVVLGGAVARQLRGVTDGAAEHGVAEYLAAAPDLVALWQHAKDGVGTEGGHPRGHRLVAAAVDLARIGVESADADLLEAAHTHYPLPASSRPESFARALDWAGVVRFGASGLLIPTTTDNTRWRPFDYLLDEATIPVPDQIWDTALAHIDDPNTLFAIGLAAHRTGLLVLAEAPWRKAADGGHTDAMFSLGLLLKGRGETSEAETWWRRAAEDGDTFAMNDLGLLLKGRGETSEAETWWRRAAEDGNIAAMINLGILLHRRGETSEAETWYRSAIAEDSHTGVMNNLGLLLQDRGEFGEAEAWLRRAIAEDDRARPMLDLAILLEGCGQSEEAAAWRRRAAEAEGM